MFLNSEHLVFQIKIKKLLCLNWLTLFFIINCAASVRVGKVFIKGDAGEFSTLKAAVEAVGETNKTLVVTDAQKIDSDLTIPANVTLKFSDSGCINPVAAATVMIKGAVQAETSQQIFGGTGKVRFEGNTTIEKFYPQWWGVVGDNDKSPRDRRAFQAMIDAVPDYSTIRLSNNLHIALDDSLVIDGRNGLTIEGEAGTMTGAVGIGIANPYFNWTGARGGTMIRVNRGGGIRLRGFSMFAKISPDSLPEAGVAIDMDETKRGTNTMTESTIESITIWFNGSRSSFVGIRLANFSNDNVEFIKIKGTTVICSNQDKGFTQTGIGLQIGSAGGGGGSNALGIKVGEDSSFQQCAAGVRVFKGQVYVSGVNTTNNLVDFMAENGSIPLIERVNSEGARQFAILQGNNPSMISNNRIAGERVDGDRASISAKGDNGVTSGGPLFVVGNGWSANADITVYDGGSNATLFSMGNLYPNNKKEKLNFQKFAGGGNSVADILTIGAFYSDGFEPRGLNVSRWGVNGITKTGATKRMLDLDDADDVRLGEHLTVTSKGIVGVGTATPNAAAEFQIDSTTRGFLPPRMTTQQINAIRSPPEGLIVYDLTIHKLKVRTVSKWEIIASN